MNKKAEKKRCSNFSSFEIDLLIKLVEERNEILKCPKLDAITVEKRNTAWREITQLFNSNEAISVFRNEEKLKKKYSNIRCERNKIGKLAVKSEETTQSNEIAQANDNAVADIVKKENTDENSGNNVVSNKTLLKDEKDKFNYELTDECSEDFSDSSSNTVDDEPVQFNKYEKDIQVAANKFAETNNNIITEKAKLEMEIMSIEHEERMKLMKVKHENDLKDLELQRMKYHLELELLNVEIAVKRKKLKKEHNF